MRWIMVTLPVSNLKVSAAFFAELGFTFSPELSGPDTVCMLIDQNIGILLVTADRYRGRINGDTGGTGSGGEVLICVSASNELEVDEIVTKAIVAGGKPWPLADEGPVYSGSFQDPDGHLWQVACPREPARQEPAVLNAGRAA